MIAADGTAPKTPPVRLRRSHRALVTAASLSSSSSSSAVIFCYRRLTCRALQFNLSPAAARLIFDRCQFLSRRCMTAVAMSILRASIVLARVVLARACSRVYERAKTKTAKAITHLPPSPYGEAISFSPTVQISPIF